MQYAVWCSLKRTSGSGTIPHTILQGITVCGTVLYRVSQSAVPNIKDCGTTEIEKVYCRHHWPTQSYSRSQLKAWQVTRLWKLVVHVIEERARTLLHFSLCLWAILWASSRAFSLCLLIEREFREWCPPVQRASALSNPTPFPIPLKRAFGITSSCDSPSGLGSPWKEFQFHFYWGCPGLHGFLFHLVCSIVTNRNWTKRKIINEETYSSEGIQVKYIIGSETLKETQIIFLFARVHSA